jgi:hypothetical protein
MFGEEFPGPIWVVDDESQDRAVCGVEDRQREDVHLPFREAPGHLVEAS